MQILDIITKKKLGQPLTREEITFFARGAADKTIPDYQLAALLMAIRLNGMTAQETTDLTLAMRDSGDVCDLSAIPGKKIDKHSTGGVGDKTTLIVAPITSKAGKKPSQPTHYYAERIHGLDLPGMVLLEQIKTIDKRRVKKYLGRMTRQQMDEIGEAIEEALGLYVPEEVEAP